MNITNYDSIKIDEPTLVVLDIDHTILKFNSISKNWWDETKNKYEQFYDKETADKLALEDWKEIIKTNTAELIDKDSFHILLKKIKDSKSELTFITARHESLKEYTIKHLRECGIDILPEYIHHAWPKSKKIIEIYNQEYNHLQKIVFVDDDITNINDVQNNTLHLNIDCYYLQHERLM